MSEYNRRSPRDRQLLVGDAEREAVGDILRREHLAGRIDNEEFDERVTRCLAAKTYNELDELIRDLPGSEPDLRWRPARPARRPRAFPYAFLPFVLAAIIFSHGRAAWLLVPFIWFIVRQFSVRERARQTIRAR